MEISQLIKTQREKLSLTQAELANRLAVSEKTVSKWETGRGLPDVSIIPSLTNALEVSVDEFLRGSVSENKNETANLVKCKFYVCPECGNVVLSVGEINASCHGKTLMPLAAQNAVFASVSGNEIVANVDSSMTKDDSVSFIAYVTQDGVDLRKLYPEQSATAVFLRRGHGFVCYYAKKHGFFIQRI